MSVFSKLVLSFFFFFLKGSLPGLFTVNWIPSTKTVIFRQSAIVSLLKYCEKRRNAIETINISAEKKMAHIKNTVTS